MPQKMQNSSQKLPAEFDAHAQTYDGGMDNSVKALLGDSGDDFVAVKLRWLLRQYPDLRDCGEEFCLLDYGCGTATLLRLMAQAGLHVVLTGSDISSGMLEQAAQQWPSSFPQPTFVQQDGARVSAPPKSFDLIVISAVLHHVPVDQRVDVYAELHRLLRPGGRLVVFEHNPLNPVTRYVVAHTPIDENAILLRAREVSNGLAGASFVEIHSSYLMFVPPRLQQLASLEWMFRWLPLGAQYAVTASRIA